jgi:hypothetical protein
MGQWGKLLRAWRHVQDDKIVLLCRIAEIGWVKSLQRLVAGLQRLLAVIAGLLGKSERPWKVCRRRTAFMARRSTQRPRQGAQNFWGVVLLAVHNGCYNASCSLLLELCSSLCLTQHAAWARRRVSTE